MINESIQRVTDIIGEITAASQEQARDFTKEVGVFTVSDNGRATGPRPAVVVRPAVPAASKGSMKRIAKTESPKVRGQGENISHHELSHELVGVASGDGKDRRQSHDDFDEF